ncbi:MAG: rhomboid family intramembrane serine protease [Ferruginibacter sp.]
MGEADRYGEFKKPKRSRLLLGQENNALVALFAINIAIFLILTFINLSFVIADKQRNSFNSVVLQWFTLPAGLVQLSERPWTLFTYYFSEFGNIIRLISNMIWLWAFGYLLQQMAGNDKIIPVYIYGGVVGGLFYIAMHYILPPLSVQIGTASLLGANTGVLAVAMATTTLSPDYRFFRFIRNGIPIWVLMGLYILIDFAGIASESAAISLSHLGAVLAGYLFVVFLRKGKDGSKWMNNFYSWLINLFNPYKKPSKEKIKETVFYNTDGRKPFKKTSIVTQQRVDEILDKISQKGYHFLTEEEKGILKKAAEKDEL